MKSFLRYILPLMVFCMPVGACAEGFFDVSWSRFVRTGTVPEVTQSFDLGTGYGDYNYRVRVDYPEYAGMTRAERKRFKRLGLKVADSLTVSTVLGVSRKNGVLDVSALPVVKRGGQLLKLTGGRLTLLKTLKGGMASVEKTAGRRSLQNRRRLAAATSDASARYTDHSVLASGRWVKIKVQDDGVYSLTSDFLRSLGFSDPGRVKLYGYGGHMLSETLSYDGTDGHFDDLEEVPLLRRTNDMLFYANGVVDWTLPQYDNTTGMVTSRRIFNPYSNDAFYFLTEGDDPMAFSTSEVPAGEVVSRFTTFPEHALIESDGFSWLQSGRNLYENYNYADGNSRNYNLNLPGIDTTQEAAVQIKMSAGNYSSTSVGLTANGYSLGQFQVGAIPDEYSSGAATTQTYTTGHLTQSNTFNVRTTRGMNARLDYIMVNYTRQLRFNGTFMPFTYVGDGVCEFIMTGTDDNTQIWRLGSPGSPAERVQTVNNGQSLTFRLNNSAARYVAVNTSGTFPEPERAGVVENQDLHADSLCDMVMIIPTSGKLLSEAQRLADFHRNHDGLRVNIVRADKLYNEFSSGTPDATAYRKYLKMLYDRATTETDMPKYLLLFGSCVWDNRMLTSATRNLSPDDYLLSYESDDNSVSLVYSYTSDDYFGYLDDGEGRNIRSEKLDLGIGRIPVTSAADAATVVDKTIAYIENQNTGNWKNNVYMLADDGNNNSHMQDAEAVVRNIERYTPALQTKRIYWDAYERVSTATGNTYPAITTQLKNIMKRGALVMNYSGHGAPYCLSHEQVLKLADFKEFSSANIPLWVVASCELTPFDMLEENIGETSLLSKTGAAIAFYSASRAAYSTQNRYVNNYFMHYALGKNSAGRRYTLGEAARLAKVSLVSTVDASFSSNSDYTINKLKYALMGDPALTLSMPTYNVVVDKLNGQALTDSAVQTLKAGSRAVVSGHIETPDGQPLDTFNGALTLTLQDSRDTITCRNNAGDDVSNYVYYERTKTLYEGSDSVRAGTFETTIPVPLDISYTGRSGRLSFYAVNNDKTIEANGYNENFNIGGTDSEALADSLGPSLYIYLNNPDFQDGGTVNETPYFYAVLSDSDGINRTGNGVGHDLELVIDGREEYTYILNDYFVNDFGSYTRGTVSYRIPTLAEGDHRLFFRAWDMKNNASSAILNFYVKAGLSPSLTDVSLSVNPASSGTTFIISYDRPETETDFHIEVFDCFGRKWWDHTETAQTSGGYHTIFWNLASNNGVALPSGLYLYKVGIRCAGSKETTKTKKLVIRRQ